MLQTRMPETTTLGNGAYEPSDVGSRYVCVHSFFFFLSFLLPPPFDPLNCQEGTDGRLLATARVIAALNNTVAMLVLESYALTPL